MNQTWPFRPDVLLRVEALLILTAACAAYQYRFPHHWGLFACLFLVPDLSLLLFVNGPGKVSSGVYNSLHTYALPLLLGAISVRLGRVPLEGIAFIWITHIAMDRVLGFGLKYPAAFKFTHIQATKIPIDPDTMGRGKDPTS